MIDLLEVLIFPIVKNKYTKLYLKYVYVMLSIQQIHLRIYVLNENTLQLYF